MPRPTDTYTHSQFTPVEGGNSDNPRSASVRCKHCNDWTGNVRSLDRKKMHLQKCAPYAAWRAAGNGEELQPSLLYRKRARASDVDNSFQND